MTFRTVWWGELSSCYQSELVPEHHTSGKILLLASLQPGTICCRVLNQISCDREPQNPSKFRHKHASCQSNGSIPKGYFGSWAGLEKSSLPFIASLELCHSSVTKANVTAVLFEAALINSSPNIMMIKPTEVKISQPAARHQLEMPKREQVWLLTALLNGMWIANWAHISHLLHRISSHPFTPSSSEL